MPRYIVKPYPGLGGEEVAITPSVEYCEVHYVHRRVFEEEGGYLKQEEDITAELGISAADLRGLSLGAPLADIVFFVRRGDRDEGPFAPFYWERRLRPYRTVWHCSALMIVLAVRPVA